VGPAQTIHDEIFRLSEGYSHTHFSIILFRIQLEEGGPFMATITDNVLPGLVINTIRLKNIYLYDELEYNFQPGITLIKGEQYSGKTDIFKAVAIALGVTDERIVGRNLKDIIGEKEKAEIDLFVGYDEYETQIHTEIYPDKIKWQVDNEEKNQDAIRSLRAMFGISLIDRVVAIPHYGDPMQYFVNSFTDLICKRLRANKQNLINEAEHILNRITDKNYKLRINCPPNEIITDPIPPIDVDYMIDNEWKYWQTLDRDTRITLGYSFLMSLIDYTDSTLLLWDGWADISNEIFSKKLAKIFTTITIDRQTLIFANDNGTIEQCADWVYSVSD